MNSRTPRPDRSDRSDPGSVRDRLERALAGDVVTRPVYAVYDWFVQNRPVDWPALFARGLGQIVHVDLVRVEHPHLEVVETIEQHDGAGRREVRWITDRGELWESYEGEWQHDYLIKRPEDYRILARAFADTRYTATSEFFDRAEAELGDAGITLGHLGWTPLRRTPLLDTQIEFTGPERLALDLADRVPGLLDLLDLLKELTLEKLRQAVKTPSRYIKLWDNLTIEMIGVSQFREHLAPMYRAMVDILTAAGKRLLVHCDGKLRVIAEDIAALGIDGIDSFTPPPEGDMSAAEARACWPDKFLWLHPPLGWYQQDLATLRQRVQKMARDAGPRRYCLMISEDVPPAWQQTVPAVLEALETL